MSKVRELITQPPCYAMAATSVQEIARTLRDENIGAVIVCDDDRRLQGVVTDRDIAVEVVAAGADPATLTAADLVGGRAPITIGADDSVSDAIGAMARHAVRRLPVIEGDRVIGMLSQADIAGRAPAEEVAEMLSAISRAPDNSGTD